MWNAFGNGSGLHGGGAGGGGNVPSQGWEFVPCSRLERAERGRGKSRSPLRRISSPPTVFSQIFETGGTVGGVGGGGGTPLEVLRGQIWPGHEPQQQQQQSQHTRLKKKFEDLKKRHGHDKEEWMRQKESLLREVADIQVIGVKSLFFISFHFVFVCVCVWMHSSFKKGLLWHEPGSPHWD